MSALLTDYFDLETIQQLQDALAAVARVPVRICRPDGEPLVGPYSISPEANIVLRAPRGPAPRDPLDVPLLVDELVVGWIKVDREALGAGREKSAPATQTQALLRLMANVIARICDRETKLHSRVEELATLYKLTAEFTEQRDLQKILDTAARTVVDVMNVKACAIRLLNIERNELLIRAVANLSPQYLDKGPILLSESKIDQEVLATDECVYIADMRTDPRVVYPSEIGREGIVSGLCAPLTYKGRAEGVIRVYAAEPYEFDWFERSLLKAIAAQAATAIVNARLYQAAVKSADIKRQLNLAGVVQRRMIPAEPPVIPGFELAAIYVPSLELSGDFYDFIRLPSNNLGVGICDVVGKGVRASLLMASIRASLRAHAVNVYEMSDVLEKVNSDFCADTQISDFATLFYAVLNVNERRLTYANAGHIPPLLIRDGQIRQLSTGGGVLGVDPHGHWDHESFTLCSGDVIFAYTDGLSEAINFDDEAFGSERVEATVLEAVATGQCAEGVAKHVLWQMRRFAGLQKRFDDLTLLAIRVL